MIPQRQEWKEVSGTSVTAAQSTPLFSTMHRAISRCNYIAVSVGRVISGQPGDHYRGEAGVEHTGTRTGPVLQPG